MRYLPLSLFIALLIVGEFLPGDCCSKTFPAEGARLNYRLIGFSFPAKKGCTAYQIQIDTGKVFEPARFKALQSSSCSKSNRIIAEVPEFGTDYSWRIVYTINNKTSRSDVYHFSTLPLPAQNYQQSRLNVTAANDGSNDYFVLADEVNLMYDMQGKPVWFLPQIGNFNAEALDMKCTPAHTISLIYGPGACEISYDGDVLWQKSMTGGAPSPQAPGINNQRIHHEFTRLSNGHYLALLSEIQDQPRPVPQNNGQGNHHFFPNGSFRNTICEYDSAGSTVWSWKSDDYLHRSDLAPFYLYVARKWNIPFFNSHENSLYFDEKEGAIYLSYAGFNRIIKISYPSGNVVSTYGALYDSLRAINCLSRFSEAPKDINDITERVIFKNGLFNGQHTCRKTKEGYLLVYNNNMLDTGVAPEILLLKENGKAGMSGNGLETVWTFTCPTDSPDNTLPNAGGGAVSELPDGSFFVSMNAPHGKMFIVNRNKKILWSAVPEKSDNGKWQKFFPYRASILTRADLERLIWKSEQLKSPGEEIELSAVLPAQ